MSRWLSEISFFDDAEPHAAALNMAMDEALLEATRGPVFRVYRWARPAVSFGYFERWGPIRGAHPDREPVRRWTGGGVVLHGSDFTYSLLVPRPERLDPLPPGDSYALIHGALSSALVDAGIAAEPASFSSPNTSHSCFENPVQHDVLVRGEKVAGAAQRRTRSGLIHQGSVQGLALPKDFGFHFASRLGGSVRPQFFDVIENAKELAEKKYGAARWLEKYP